MRTLLGGTVSGWALRATLAPNEPCAVIPVSRDRFTIGRRPGLDLTLKSRFISSKHIELARRDRRLFVVDLSSRNGVLVNGERVRQCEVGVGDRVLIGDVELRIEHVSDQDGRGEEFRRTMTEMRADWLQTQFPKLLEQGAVSATYTPVAHLDELTPDGFRMAFRSDVSGLESSERMTAAACALDRELELTRACLAAAERASRSLDVNGPLFIPTGPSQNLQADLLPALHDWRQQMTNRRVVIELHMLRRRSLRSLQLFAQEIRQLGMEFTLIDFDIPDLEFLRKARIQPGSVVLSTELTTSIDAKPEEQLRRLRTLIDDLHNQKICVRADDLRTAAAVDVCRDVGIDQVEGPQIGVPQASPCDPQLETRYQFQLGQPGPEADAGLADDEDDGDETIEIPLHMLG